MRVHCLIRPRRGGGYVAECLELGMYYVEGYPGLAMKTLEEALKSYEEAVKYFTGQDLPVHSVRSAGYWWKRPAWSVFRILNRIGSILVASYAASQARGDIGGGLFQAVSCDIRLPA